MKIYTKTGDDGSTALFDGQRVQKDHARVRAYGEIDELNACLGLALSFIKDDRFRSELQLLQKDLFALGAILANPARRKQNEKAVLGEDAISRLEKSIDTMEEKLPPLTRFILPGGESAAAALHLARTVCRRAEREAVVLAREGELEALAVKFLNRISDYLFVAARLANHLEGREEIPW